MILRMRSDPETRRRPRPHGLGARIAAARVAAGITKAELARRAGVDWGTIHRWETSTSAPDADNMARLARGCGVTVDELLGHVTGEREPVSEAWAEFMARHGEGLTEAERVYLSGQPWPVGYKPTFSQYVVLLQNLRAK